MALVLKDRVKETTVTAGTGTITLAGASVGYQSFSAIGNANTTYYCIAGQGTTEWEVGIGTYTASGTTLSRDTILASSNSGSVVTFSAGTKDVFVVYPAGKSVNLDASGNATALGTPASGVVTNLTGTASININGTVGATTPTTGAFTTLSATGVATFSAGSAAAPAITTSGDTNNGIFFPAADVTAITTAGSERMRIDSSGSVGIGTTVLTNRKLTVGGSATGATGYTMVLVAPTVQPDVTTSNINIASQHATASNSGTPYTITSLICFNAAQGTFNADSTVTNQYGFAALSSLTGATNNYGFYSAIASGTGRWNFYANGTANNYFAGNVGIGSTSLTQYNLRISKTITGNADSIGILVNGLVQSDVTASATYNQSQIGLAASAFTLTNAYGFYAGQTALSGGAAITSQSGFYAASTLTGATNNYGFRSDIASGTGRWNFYANGTANNYFAGNVGIGTSSPGAKLHVSVTDASSALKIERTGAGATSYTADFSGAVFNQSISGGADFVWIEGGAEWMRLTNTGNVGIGTSSPLSRLQVEGARQSATIKSVINVFDNQAFAVDVGAGVGMGGKIDALGALAHFALIAGRKENATSANTAGYLAFETRPNGGNLTERMRINSSGNVGIGTSSPAKQLDLAASNTGITTGDPLNTLRFTDTDTTSASGQPMGRIEWYSADADTAGVKAYIQAQSTDGSPDADMVFATNHVSGGGTAERMRIQYDGNVGIGTTSPSAKLQVDSSSATYSANIRVRNSNFGNGVVGAASNILTVATDMNNMAFYTASNLGVDGASAPTNERMRIDSSGNVGVNSTSPAQYATSGKVLNITGTANNSGPAVQVMSGSSASPGAGNYIREVFAIASISNTATEITRITGTGANGMSMYIRVTASGHTSGVGNGSNYKAVRYDGGTTAVTQVETATSGSVPPITFDTATSNILIIKLASSTASQTVNGVMVVEWFVPIDFASNTWVVS